MILIYIDFSKECSMLNTMTRKEEGWNAMQPTRTETRMERVMRAWGAGVEGVKANQYVFLFLLHPC